MQKLGYSLLVLWGVITLVFFLFQVLPGDPARMMLDQREDAEQLKNIKAKYGFDLPLYAQYGWYLNDLSPLSYHPTQGTGPGVEREGKYAGFSFGRTEHAVWYLKWPYLRESFQQQGVPVAQLIGNVVVNTAVLALAAIVIAFVLGVALGVLAALRQNTWLDRFLLVFGSLGMSIPSFFAAILMAWLFGFLLADYTGLGMTGSLWEVDDYGEGVQLRLDHLILPAVTLGIRPLGVILQLTRSSLLEVFGQDYIRTARAKGLTTAAVVWKHALRNALNPVITATSGWFASLLAGAVFVEYIFGWNGLGKLLVEALNQLDLPVVMGSVLLIGATFVCLNLVVDLAYAWLDPRLRKQ